MTSFDFVEIGTSDFDTELQKAKRTNPRWIGLSVDPLQFYLDRLPNLPLCTKVCAAISDSSGKCQVFFVHPSDIMKHNLPSYIKGCNSIGAPHPSVVDYLKQHKLSHLQQQKTVAQMTLLNLLEKQKVSAIFFLKIDTEGHDTTILNKFVATTQIWPHVIMFESNKLSSNSAVLDIIQKLHRLGYDLKKKDNDTVLHLNLTRRAQLQPSTHHSQFSPFFYGYVVHKYPPGYDPLEHENTLQAAQRVCVERKGTAVVWQDGRFQVRVGSFLIRCGGHVVTWVYH